MGKLLKWLVIIAVLVLGVRFVRTQWEKSWKENFSPDHKNDAVDIMIGRQALGYYQDIKEKQDSFNLPAFKTTMMMYYTQHGRFPQTVQELERSGDVSRDITHDHFGNPYSLKYFSKNKVRLQSAGRDKIKGTTDDLQYDVNL